MPWICTQSTCFHFSQRQTLVGSVLRYLASCLRVMTKVSGLMRSRRMFMAGVESVESVLNLGRTPPHSSLKLRSPQRGGSKRSYEEVIPEAFAHRFLLHLALRQKQFHTERWVSFA